MKTLATCVLSAMCSVAAAQDLPGFEQRLGEPLPLTAQFLNEQGQHVNIREYFDKGPVIIVFGYYRCPRLCSTVMDGVLQGLQGVELPYTVLGIGIDPAENPVDAARKHKAYAATLDTGATLHLLTGKREQISKMANSAGFHYSFNPESQQYVHPAGFLVATPQGYISRYFEGLRFNRRDVRLALIEADSGRVGTLTEKVLLWCSHYDPVTGQYTVAIMRIVRAGALAFLLMFLAAIYALNRKRA